MCSRSPAAKEPFKYGFGPQLGLEADLQLQTMTTWWQALPSVDRVRGHRDGRGFAEHHQRVGSRQEDHDWVRAPSGWQNVARPAESRAKGQSRVHLPGMSLPMEPETALPPPAPGPLRATPLRPGIYLCHWTVPVTLKPRFTFSRTFISGSFMTLGECAKFLIRLARQPEAAAAPRSLHGLSALQHNKPLYSFEDNADYVYDVMWSPVHPALFACVDGMGRLDLWNLNNDTEVSGGAGAGPGGGEGGAVSLSPSPPRPPNSLCIKNRPFLDRPSYCSWAAGPRFWTALKGIGRCIAKNHLISLRP